MSEVGTKETPSFQLRSVYWNRLLGYTKFAGTYYSACLRASGPPAPKGGPGRRGYSALVSGPVSMGARTRLPHSTQEPS